MNTVIISMIFAWDVTNISVFQQLYCTYPIYVTYVLLLCMVHLATWIYKQMLFLFRNWKQFVVVLLTCWHVDQWHTFHVKLCSAVVLHTKEYFCQYLYNPINCNNIIQWLLLHILVFHIFNCMSSRQQLKPIDFMKC